MRIAPNWNVEGLDETPLKAKTERSEAGSGPRDRLIPVSLPLSSRKWGIVVKAHVRTFTVKSRRAHHPSSRI